MKNKGIGYKVGKGGCLLKTIYKALRLCGEHRWRGVTT